MIKYKIRQDLISNPDGNTYQAYGIDVTDTDTNKIIDSIPDISFDRLKLKTLIDDCNELNVDMIHIYNIIEDFLP